MTIDSWEEPTQVEVDPRAVSTAEKVRLARAVTRLETALEGAISISSKEPGEIYAEIRFTADELDQISEILEKWSAR